MKMKKTLIAALVAVSAAAVVHAESITQAVPNTPSGASDWNVPATWSNNEAPSSGNTYSITNRLNSPDTPATPQTFAGDSLLLDGSSCNLQLRCRNGETDAVTVNLILNGGKVALNQASSSYGLVQGEMSVIGTTTLWCYQNETQIRSMRVDSLVSGGTTLKLVSSTGYSQPGDSYIQIGNALNTFSGTWDINDVRGIFTSAGATGADSSFVVGSGGYLRIDESFSGNSMSVTNGAEVQVNTNVTYFLTSLTANGSPVATGSYSVAELNTETSSTIFSGDGDIVIDTDAAANLPQFIEVPIVKADATNGVDYAALGQTLAGSATNAFGDTMSYEVVDGPAWLVVATNGALSGTPTATGLAEFTIKATTGDFSSYAELQITVAPLGSAPAFTTDPIVKVDGMYDEEYGLLGQTLDGSASDPDGDDLTFALDGSGWLSVASNGDLSGVPNVIGTNTFNITVDDGNGNTDTATLLIFVDAPPLGDLLAGWEHFDDASENNAWSASHLNGATATLVAVADVTANDVWRNWTSKNTSTNGTYGSWLGAVADTGTALTNGIALDNSDGSITITLTDTTGADREISGFHFDASRRFASSADEWSLDILAGSAIDVSNSFASGIIAQDLNTISGEHDVSFASMTDKTLEANGTIIFRLNFTGTANEGTKYNTGNMLMLDNIGISAAVGGSVVSPVMEISDVSGGNLTIEWEGSGFKLQTRPSLTTGVWDDYGISSSPATVPATNEVEFLRLIQE